jgi:hypothetical protein
MQQHQVPGN